MNKKNLYIVLCFVFLSIVGAVQVSNFEGYSNSENLTFTGNENITRNITVYKDANVTSANINLSGYSENILFADFEDGENLTSASCGDSLVQSQQTNVKDGSWGGVSNSISGFSFPSNSRDYISFWANFTDASSQTYIQPRRGCGGTSRTFETILSGNSAGNQTINNNTWYLWEFVINYTTFTFDLYIDSTLALSNQGFTINAGSVNSIRFYNTAGSILYLDNITIGRRDLTSNPYLYINNTNIWNHTGEFNSTFSLNQTSDLSDTLNTALNSGACDCSGCTLSGDNCSVNFTFHSDSAGLLEYSAIDINWLEYTNPNVTISKPTGEDNDTQIDYNISVVDNQFIDTCIVWIMRGASVEVANDSISCTSETTGTTYVSSTGTDYVFHLFTNDTSGNINETTSNFSVASGGVIITPPSGGGGSSTIRISEKGWIMEVADGINKFEADMSKGTRRTFKIQFENLGDSSRTIELTCEDVEGSSCKYVEFPEDTFELALIKDTKQSVDFIINLPDDADNGNYQFNIGAKDDKEKEGSVTMFLGIGTLGLIPAFISKALFSSTSFGFPYVLIFFPSLIFGFVVFSRVFTKKVPMRAIWILLTSGLISVLLVSFI